MQKGLMPQSRQQQGAVLVISLIFMVVLTLIGITSVSMSVMEEKMAHNLHDANLAFQAAESALRDGESWLTVQTEAPKTTCPTTPCELWALDNLNGGIFTNQTQAWWETNARPYSNTLSKVASPPRFVIEQHSFVPDGLVTGAGGVSGAYYYRVTARGTGGTDTAQVIVQSTYSRRY